MYCSEQIVIPEKISNLLKTYAKAALKTQPYDLLRWSAAYFRCLSEDELPPVKPRYEHENVFGCLTRGYLKVLMNQVGNGYFVRRDILEHRWSGLCLPEDELLKFLSITRMLYWPQLHWLKLISVMVGSLNQSFIETMSMLCELLTDEPEGGSAPVPLWIFRECFKFLAELDCSATQTFFDGRKVISEGKLEHEHKIANLPRKISSISYRNAVLEYWQQRIENNVEKEPQFDDISHESIPKSPDDTKPTSTLRATSAITIQHGSDFNIVGDFSDPHEIIKRSLDFEGILSTVQQMRIDDDDRNEMGELTDEQRDRIAQHYEKIAELKEKLFNNSTTTSSTDVNNVKSSIENEFYQLLRDIGPPWNWLHRFVNQTCNDKSFNFIEKTSIESFDETTSDMHQLNYELRATTATSSTLFDEEKSTVTLSEASGICISLLNVDDDAASDVDNMRVHHHQVLVETICSISEASDNGGCDIKDTSSISCFLDEQHSSKLINSADYGRLKKFIDKAQERGLAFNDLNELYNYFIQESSREHATMAKDAARDIGEFEVDGGNLAVAIDEMQTDEEIDGKKNVVAIFGESGIEVDGKLLEAKVSDRMILGLVDKGSDDNLSDVASSISSVSHAETVRMKQNSDVHIIRERNTQTASYREQIHSRRLQNKHAVTRKTKSASSIKRQPFVCKIPPLPGVGVALDSDKLDRLLRLLTHRSLQQGGFVYPRNLHEDEFLQIIRD